MANKNHSSVEIEKALLGVLLVNNKTINKVRGYIVSTDFFDIKNRLVFEAIESLIDRDFDLEIPGLITELKKLGNLDKIGGDQYLISLMADAGLESNIVKYIQEITDKSKLRNVKEVIENLNVEIDKSDATADALFERVEQDILSATREVQQKDFQDSSTVVKNTLDDIEMRAAQEGISGLASELPSLDEMTSGFQKGDLIIVAARPSMGKTAFALNIAANISRNHRVALFSLEMPAVQLMKRVLSFTGYIDGKKLREPSKMTSEENKKLYIASEKAQKLNLFIDDSAGIKLSEIVWKAKKLHKNGGLDMLVVDYLQLINITSKNGGDNRQAEVSLISRTLKQLARELDIPVIALSQLSRRVEQREDKTPMMSDLRESGAIEQDADIISFLYREAYYSKEANLDAKHQTTKVIIAKHRNGSIGNIELSFNPSIGLFTDTPSGTGGNK